MNRIHYNQNVVVLGARRDITQTLTLLAIRQMTMMTRLTFQNLPPRRSRRQRGLEPEYDSYDMEVHEV